MACRIPRLAADPGQGHALTGIDSQGGGRGQAALWSTKSACTGIDDDRYRVAKINDSNDKVDKVSDGYTILGSGRRPVNASGCTGCPSAINARAAST